MQEEIEREQRILSHRIREVTIQHLLTMYKYMYVAVYCSLGERAAAKAVGTLQNRT